MTTEKTYSLRGKVIKVYDPREVVMRFGNKKVVKEVSDLYLQLETGPKVKVSFWDTDVSHHEGSLVVISALQFKGKYKDTAQYSATKETTISVTKQGKPVPAAVPEEVEESPEGATLEGEPTFGADGAPADEAETGAPEEVEPEPVKVVRKKSLKPLTLPPLKTASKTIADVGHTVDPEAIAIVESVAIASQEIVDRIAPAIVKKDAQAYQALFATIFINLGLKDYHSSNGGR